jgi:Flp pilus assembly protein TadG
MRHRDREEAMTTRTVPLIRRAARFVRDRRAVTSLEFAILLPLLVGLYLGSAEVAQGIAIKRKVTLTAHAVADLSSQYTAINNGQMSNVLNAASAIIAPYTSSNLQATVSEISINAQGQATVVWSDSLNGTALPIGLSVTVPPALAVPNTFLILGQAQYSYSPTYGYVLTNALTLSDQIFLMPRQSTSIARNES